MRRARSCNFSSLLLFFLPQKSQATGQYEKLDRIKLLYTDSRLSIFRYFENRLKELICLEARLHISSTYDLKLNLSSSVTPRTLISFVGHKSLFLTEIGVHTPPFGDNSIWRWRLISTMGLFILIRRHLYIGSGESGWKFPSASSVFTLKSASTTNPRNDLLHVEPVSNSGISHIPRKVNSFHGTSWYSISPSVHTRWLSHLKIQRNSVVFIKFIMCKHQADKSRAHKIRKNPCLFSLFCTNYEQMNKFIVLVVLGIYFPSTPCWCYKDTPR